ncbi:MAG TPA: tetraacyldisaccharide 4'-kinase [Methylophilaceae bacterium]|nr:tetraacyldisaccharide 4'-kinase [Methylophilaceae bacterium]
MSQPIRAWFSQALQNQWYRLAPWHILLIPLSWLFWLLSGLRRLFYKAGLFKSYQLPVPLIVVGNISVGGTGKTPFVIWLAQKLQQSGYRPGIVTRGYGGSATGGMPVHDDSDPSLVGDEPVLLARQSKCPVWMGRDRVTAAQGLLKMYPECNVVISDDGLQHYRLKRDIEIAVVDSSRGFGNGWLLPAGPLREKTSRLTKVDAIVCNGDTTATKAYPMKLQAVLFNNLLDPDKTAMARDFAGQRLYAVAGIGNPQRFFQQLEGMGLQFERQAFPDHHAFTAADLQIDNADAILMTEKDAVKCSAFAKPNWWYLPVSAVIDEALLERILNKLRN